MKVAETVWTKEQSDVINVRDRNILVAAAAGSGKTAVLVERILSIITEKREDPVDIDKLLVVTFTRAAAGEMRERIMDSLRKRAVLEPDNDHISRQLTYIHNSKITTIDSFLADVVRENFDKVNIEPDFRIGDEGELTLMKSDAVSNVLEKYYKEADKDFLKFVDIYSGNKSDSAIEDIIQNLYNFSMSYPYPEKWLMGIMDNYNADEKSVENSKWFSIIERDIRSTVSDVLTEIDEGLKLADEAGFDKIYDVILQDKDGMDIICRSTDFDSLRNHFNSYKFARFPSIRNLDDRDAAVKDRIKSIRDSYKKRIADITKKYMGQSLKEMAEDVSACGNIIKSLVNLCLDFSNEYDMMKRESNIVDFNDIEHFAIDILVDCKGDCFEPSDVAKEISKNFYEIMIDEYQDSNYVQEMILNAISGRGQNINNIFMVGDVKQSIYKFRLAKPEIFMEKYNRYPAYISDSEGGADENKITLSKNFRSRASVIDFCNTIFKEIMKKNLGGIEYDKDSMLYEGMKYERDGEPDYDPELLILDVSDDEKENYSDDEKEDYSHVELEAAMVAEKIKSIVGRNGGKPLEVFDKQLKIMRPAKYSDICILFRSLKENATIYNQILMQEGIPAYTDLREGYFETFEVESLLNLLQVIDNPFQDIPLASVLRNIFGFTDNMLADIRIASKSSFSKGFFNYNGIYESSVKDVIKKISKYREMVSYTSIYELLLYILEDTAFMDFVSSMKAGEKRRANIEMLLEKAVAYENSAYSGLFNFVRYIEKIRKYNVAQGEASTSGENENSVKIMTIHKSKGLEYPVVIVASLGKRMNMADIQSRIVINSTYGVGIDYVDTDRRLRKKTALKMAVARQTKLENLAEEQRILYVALTRAREKLILAGTCKMDKKQEKYQYLDETGGSIPNSCIEEAVSYLDWILMALYKTGKIKSVLEKYTVKDIVFKAVKQKMESKDRYDELCDFDCKKVYDGDLRKRLRDEFNWIYAYEEEKNIKAKVSISDIKHMYMKGLYDDEQPQQIVEYAPVEEIYDNEDMVAPGAVRGTAYHRFFELWDYKNEGEGYRDIEYIRERLNDFVTRGLMEKESSEMINLFKVKAFLTSPLARRMSEADRLGLLNREKPFVIGIEACKIYTDVKSSEPVIVQGIVDAWFEEDGQIVVVDYKTDSVKEIGQLKDRYESQLLYYGMALEKITKKPVKSRIIYSVSHEDTLEV